MENSQEARDIWNHLTGGGLGRMEGQGKENREVKKVAISLKVYWGPSFHSAGN